MSPLLLDLFCGAGGAAKGYADAGFDVIGVDIRPQPNYPYTFIQADAIDYLCDLQWRRSDADVIHASPPCQSYSRALKHLAAPTPMLIGPVRDLLLSSGIPYVIENVQGAPLRSPLRLCGTSFGIRVWRHRLFETSIPIPPLTCDHGRFAFPINVDCAPTRVKIRAEFGSGVPLQKLWAKEIGVEWMNGREAGQSFPPAYTQYIGAHLLAALESEGIAA